MIKKLFIEFNDVEQPTIQIGMEDDSVPNAWEDIFILCEALGVLTKICQDRGIKEHNGKPLIEYIHYLLDEAIKHNIQSYCPNIN